MLICSLADIRILFKKHKDSIVYMKILIDITYKKPI